MFKRGCWQQDADNQKAVFLSCVACSPASAPSCQWWWLQAVIIIIRFQWLHHSHQYSLQLLTLSSPPIPGLSFRFEPGTSVAEADNYRRGECGEIRIILKQRPPTNRPVIRNKLSDAPKQRSWQSAETEEAAGLDGHARRAAANERWCGGWRSVGEAAALTGCGRVTAGKTSTQASVWFCSLRLAEIMFDERDN